MKLIKAIIIESNSEVIKNFPILRRRIQLLLKLMNIVTILLMESNHKKQKPDLVFFRSY